MTDKELLELAAKAAGWTWWKSKHGYWNITPPQEVQRSCCVGWQKFDPHTGDALEEPTPADAIVECNWNPLTDDGDALRLAVKLELDVMCASVRSVDDAVDITIDAGTDIYAATRRAIVRAAAEIGKQV